MNKLETIELYKKGKEEWNKWAICQINIKDKNNVEWENNSRAIFTESKSSLGLNNFEGFIFPGETIFEQGVFERGVNFKCAVFHGCAFFSGCEFKKEANFDYCVFLSTVWFSHFKKHSPEDSTKFYSKFHNPFSDKQG